jgi:hypothetical protein
VKKGLVEAKWTQDEECTEPSRWREKPEEKKEKKSSAQPS